MILIEPTEVFSARSASFSEQCVHERPLPVLRVSSQGLRALSEAPLSYADGWDEAIHLRLLSLKGQPVPIMSLVSQLRKRVRHRNKHHREEIKRTILKRICILIKSGLLRRVRRSFVVAA